MAASQDTRIASALPHEADDPIFTAIPDLERATAKGEAAEAAANEAREAYDAACRKIGFVTYRGEEVRNFERLDDLAKRLPAVSKDYLQAHAQLAERINAFKKAERESRVVDLDDAWSEAWRAECDAAFAVVEMKPTTRAGAVAQLRVLASRFIDGDAEDRIAEIAADTIGHALDLIEGKRRRVSNFPDRRADCQKARHENFGMARDGGRS